MHQKTIEQLGDWYKAFTQLFDSIGDISSFLGQAYTTKTVYPKPENIFKAFEFCKYENLKIVVLSQDPYHNSFLFNYKEIPYATGLAFANPPEAQVRMSPSLKNIAKAVEDSGYIFFDCDLVSWAEQGILLLNTALTVEKGLPNSHKELWKPFTTKFIENLSKNSKGIIFVLWGTQAQSYKYLIDEKVNFIITAEHPIAGTYDNRTWNYNNSFNMINEILKNNNKKEILW